MTEESDDGWIEEVMRVRRPAGTHFSKSRTSDGKSPLARDDETNELFTQATLHDYEPEHAEAFDVGWTAPVGSESDAEGEPGLAELMAALLVLGAIAAAPRLAPHARRLWEERALPAIAASRERLARFRRFARKRASGELVAVVESAATDAALELAAAEGPIGEPMTTAEARERLAAALVARAFSDEQFRRLREVRIEDPDGVGLAELDIATLSPEQVQAAVVRMLEADPSLLERLLRRPLQGEQQPERRELPPADV